MTKLCVLFLCTGNSCRSQMAEGFARELRGFALEPYSAGTEPKQQVDPRAVTVMAEAGVDISAQQPKHVDALAAVPSDYVVTVCDHAAETCPAFPKQGGKALTILHVSFADPPQLAADAASEEEALAHYRRVRDEIRVWIETLPAGLTEHKEN